MSWLKILIGIVILVVVVSVFYAGMSIVLYSKENTLVQADAAIVLGAAVWGAEPSPVFRERINHGIWLYKEGYVKKLIFTGGTRDKSQPTESAVAKLYAEKNGVLAEDILVEDKSSITEENLYYAKEVAEVNGLDSFIIVSDPLHMRRAMLIAKDVGLHAVSSPTQTTRYVSWRSKIGFLAREIFFYVGYVIVRLFRALLH